MSYIPSRRDVFRLGGSVGVAVALTGQRPAAAQERTWRVTGEDVPELTHFDTVMRTFMEERGISAGSLALGRGGRLFLARGYTWGDESVTTTQPTDVFRVASVSKPITATATARLVQAGELELDTPVTELIELDPLTGETADPRLNDVTVRHLLQNLGGWDRDISGDPLWLDHEIADASGIGLPLTESDITRYVTGRELDHDPGTTYAYSNYGFLLAGQVIERVTGESYVDHVTGALLDPLGISRMRHGASLSRDTPGEANYESRNTSTTVLDDSGDEVPSPYGGFSMEVRAANGGWVASAADLVRFCSLYDDPADSGILTQSTINAIFAEPEIGGGDSWYGMGWHVRPRGEGRNTWHSGSQPGAYSYLVRWAGDYTAAVVFNRRSEGDDLDWDISSRLSDAVLEVDTWPDTDLTPIYY